MDVDGHNFPNLALMKLSAWHKSQGDQVEFVFELSDYDIIYKAKVFTFTEDRTTALNADKIIQGGTGYHDYVTLLPYEAEHIMPDYSLYGKDFALGFATRGCPNKCPWCVVPEKEGKIRANTDIYEFWNGQKNIVFLDNNMMAHENGLLQLENCIKEGIKVDCNQGLDARLIAKDIEIQKLLARVKWTKFIRVACDHKSQMEDVAISVRQVRKFSNRITPFFVYTLIQDDIQDALDRIYFLRALKYVDPFAQPYRDFETNKEPPKIQKKLARWVNMKAVFRSVEWEDYAVQPQDQKHSKRR